PVAIETMGVFGQEGLNFIHQVGRRIKHSTGESRATSYLIQRISLAIQRGNAASILGAIPQTRGLEEIFYILTPRNSTQRTMGSTSNTTPQTGAVLTPTSDTD